MKTFLAIAAWSILLSQSVAAPAQRRAGTTTSAVTDQMHAYRAWADRVEEAEAPALAAFGILSRAVMAGGASAEEVRPALERLRAAIGEVESALAAIEPLSVPLLGLPHDLSPAVMLRDARQRMRDLAGMADGVERMGDAIRRGDPAAEARGQQLTERSALLTIEAQIRRQRGVLAGMPRQSYQWEATALRVEFFQGFLLVIRSMSPGPNPALAAELAGMANRVAGFVRAGRAKLAAEIASAGTMLRQLQAQRRDAEAAMLTRRIAGRRVDEEHFSLFVEFEAWLRNKASLARTGQMPEATALVGEYRGFGERIDAIEARYWAAVDAS